MTKRMTRSLLGSTILSGVLAVSAAAYAQEVDEVPDAQDFADSDSGDKIVVTGSRLRKDAFSSPSPLETLDVESGRRIGVTNLQELLSRSSVVNGTQIDGTLAAASGNSNATEAPPTGGTGSSNIDLRGIGPERTLVLLNGRRLGASGVRGAPAQPDINLLPFSMVERVDIVTEAGSSIYGADAVAGTVNVILRNDFEGLELTASGDVPEAEGGTIYQVGFLAGAQGDRARVLFGGEFFDRERITANTRPGGATLQDIEIREDGGGLIIADRSGFLDALVVDPAFNDIICYQDGAPGGGIGVNGVLPIPANYIDCADVPVPPGFRDLGRSNFGYSSLYNDNDERGRADLVQPLETISLMSIAEVDLDWFGTNNQMYFEGLYVNRQNDVRAGNEQIAPTVPGMIAQRDANGNTIVDGTGAPVLVANPLNPFGQDVVPILTYDDLPQTFDVELQQVRFVAGMRGEFPNGWFAENDWQWDAYFSFDRGTGFVSQPILFEPHLAQSLNYYLDTTDNTVKCDPILPATDAFSQVTSPDCVVFDILAPSNFFGGPLGDGVLPSDELRDYLTGLRTNRTAIEQYIGSFFFDGELFSIDGGGVVTAGFGYEYREDIIQSQNGLVGVQGLNSAENPVPEGNTNGSRHLHEFFGEVDIPLIVGKPGVELLNIDGAVRYTDESNFGSDVTFRGRLQYKPVDWFSLSGGYGTSFRAPNLRESFLADQGGGIAGNSDPCTNAALQAAISSAPDGDMDPGIQFTIDQCTLDGVVYTDADLNGFLDTTATGNVVSTIITTAGGNLNLEPETSRTYTITASMQQPWFDAFDFDIAVSYYDIKLENSVEEPDTDVILGECYSDVEFPGLSSPLCSLVTRRQTGDPSTRQISNIDLTFFNIGEITARGFDFNTRFVWDTPLEFNNEPVNWVLTSSTSYQFEQERQVFGPEDRDDNAGEIGFPEFYFRAGSVFTWGPWSVSSDHRRFPAQFNDPSDPFNANPFLPDRPISRDFEQTPVVWYHDASLSYTADNFSISAGVNNIADRQPPQIDDSQSPQRNNLVSSAGFDFFGRSYFVSGRVNF